LGLHARSPLHWLPLLESIKALVPGTTRRIDLGKSNGRYFLQWTGLGLDAEVTYAMEPRTRVQRHLGVVAYIAAGLSIAATMAGIRTRLWIDGRRVYRRSILVVISNSPLYGGKVRIATDARLDDGLLDVDVFSGSGFISCLRATLGVISGLHIYDPRHTFYHGRSILVETEKPMAVHIDGEPFGTTPLECQVVPQALTVMLPLKYRPGLFVR
jgi:YegS/Rv2252/BmrU family lipid kinase